MQKTYNSLLAIVPGTKNWYIKQSQDILKKFDIPVLENVDDAMKLAKAGDPLHNLTWAINGYGTHRKATVVEVYNRLNKAIDKDDAVRILGIIADDFLHARKVGLH